MSKPSYHPGHNHASSSSLVTFSRPNASRFKANGSTLGSNNRALQNGHLVLSQSSAFLKLPVELILSILHHLGYESLSVLCLTCRFMNQVMLETGWKDFCYAHHCSTPSVSRRWATLSWNQRARETHLINNAWSTSRILGRPLTNRWRHKYHSVLALSANRLIVAAGNTISSYTFGYGHQNRTSTVGHEANYTVFRADSDFDISGVEFLPDGGADQTLLVSNVVGELIRIKLSPSAGEGGASEVVRTAQYRIDSKPDSIRSLTSNGNIALALGASGKATLINTASPWTSPVTTTISKVGWSAHLELGSSSPYAAFGTHEHVFIHDISGGRLSEKPTNILGRPVGDTPVYCVGQFLPGGRPDLIVSGWYDGKVRVHDMRSSRRAGPIETSKGNAPSPLAPVMVMADPWRAFDAIYTIGARGPVADESNGANARFGGVSNQSHYLTAGSARHSVVCVWDIRNSKAGWSVYGPGGENSPIYSLKVEGSRVWAATQGTAFVLDFGPEASQTAFPRVSDKIPRNLPSTYVHHPGESS
ncbi:hypothetical protein CPB86DRAFT_415169 [Serendipita vermifera]|nr:hypothetical protein CPB86DRAFT_415169 [Serendipita vermifera]